MTKPYKHRKPPAETQHVVKVRNCLMCKRPFKSEWHGHRVCNLCRQTEAWQWGERHGGR
jgi:hypothetical protein